jgi:hypothetical protein
MRFPLRAAEGPELVDLDETAPSVAPIRLARLRDRLADARVEVSQLTWYLFSEDAWR